MLRNLQIFFVQHRHDPDGRDADLKVNVRNELVNELKKCGRMLAFELSEPFPIIE